ncbi:helix-turn-helix domain-containing protein [Ferrovibrio xuzhouensis]|uniref:Helix-turn-helix domain-containing protein n=1 Tax=Ferrovibrio xuzhouensis TaxID=1576914 RepID=A0ABV7VC88_9PROT
MAICPTCGGCGHVEKAIEPVLAYDGARLTLCQGTILAILLEQRGRPIRSAELYSRYASSRDEPPQPETIKVQVSMIRRKLRAAGSAVAIVQPVHGTYALEGLPPENLAEPVSRETPLPCSGVA